MLVPGPGGGGGGITVSIGSEQAIAVIVNKATEMRRYDAFFMGFVLVVKAADLKRVGVTPNGALKDNFGANEATPQFIVDCLMHLASRLYITVKPSQGRKTSCGYHVILSNIYTGKCRLFEGNRVRNLLTATIYASRAL